MEYLLGTCLSDDRVIMILDIDSLLGHPECLDAVSALPDDAAGTY
jgi:chemotaxis signal transduction protein